jgi:hypothetical protein
MPKDSVGTRTIKLIMTGLPLGNELTQRTGVSVDVRATGVELRLGRQAMVLSY